MRAGERLVRKLEDDGTSVRLFSVGKKAGAFYRFRGIDLAEGFVGMSDRPTFEDARRIAATVAAPFVSGEAQQVLLVSTRFLSSATQSVEVEQLLPLAMPDLVDEEAPKVLKVTPSSNLRSPNSSRRSRPRPSRARSSQHS